MPRMTPMRAASIVARAAPSFNAVEDPRDEDRSRLGLGGLLALQVAGYGSGKHTFREMEELASDISPVAARILGLSGTVADNVLHGLDRRLRHVGFREAVWDQIRSDLDAKVVENDLFPGGVVSFDGKGAGSGIGQAPNSTCRQSVCDAAGTPCWDLYTLRAVLTSSSVRPCLDQELIECKSGEATTFPRMLRRVVGPFPHLFRYVTGDAGLASASNAQEVLDHRKLYVFGIKANFNRLFPLAKGLLKSAPVVAQTVERTGGSLECRQLRRVPVLPGEAFPGATQFWGVRRIWTEKGTPQTEDRIFITAVLWDELAPHQILSLPRLHWGIENNCNWTADMIFDEDSGSPCKAGNGVVVLSWLRLLAYNLVAGVRVHLPLKDRKPQRWERARDVVHHALLSA